MFRTFIDKARRSAIRALGGSNLRFYGQFGFAINGGEYQWDKNRVVDEGLNYMLNAALRGEGVLSAFYIAPFVSNVTPAANVTAATFNSALTEFTNYTETTRRQWVTDEAATTLLLVNDAAPALFTVGSGVQNAIYGAGLLSSSGKASTTGVLVAAAKRSAQLSVEEGFEVRIKYRISAASS